MAMQEKTLRGLIAAGALVGCAIATVALIPLSEAPHTQAAKLVRVEEAEAHPLPVSRATPSPSVGGSGLRHDIAPDPRAFRDYGHLQTVYDQEAKPGEFVTPPRVSVEH